MNRQRHPTGGRLPPIDDGTPVRIGSVCTGSLMLDTAVERAFGGETIWCAEDDADAARVISHHRPELPNLGDLSLIDWTALRTRPAGRIHVLSGGYPCTPFSLAGPRRGADDERHVWPYIAEGIAVLRPALLLFENVYGHLSLGLDSVLADLNRLDYEVVWVTISASRIGAPHGRKRVFIAARDTRPEGRELARRLLDRARTRTTRPGSVHCTDADIRTYAGRDHPLVDDGTARRCSTRPTAADSGCGRGNTRRTDASPEPAGRPAHGEPGRRRRAPVAASDPAPPSVLFPTPKTSDRRGAQPPPNRQGGPGLHGVAQALRSDGSALLPTPTASRYGSNRSPSPRSASRPSLDAIATLLPTPDATHGRKTTRTGLLLAGVAELLPTPGAADGGEGGHLSRGGDRSEELLLPGIARQLAEQVSEAALLPTPRATDDKAAQLSSASTERRTANGRASLPEMVAAGRFGAYQAAVDRWERILGRAAPEITITIGTRKTRVPHPVLNPDFSQWMMGWPDGWVTDPAIWSGFTPSRARNAELKIIGNGVVLQQAVAAIADLVSIWIGLDAAENTGPGQMGPRTSAHALITPGGCTR